MRIPICLCIVLALVAMAQPAAKPTKSDKPKKDAKNAAPALPKLGIKTPGVQIPFAGLKAEAEFAVAPPWMIFTDSPLLANLEKDSLDKIDLKANKLGDPITGLSKPCGGGVTAFTSLWVPTCGDKTLARLDTKTGKVTKNLPTGTAGVAPEVAASADSMWLFSDDKVTLSRIDPELNQVVAELRLPTGCNSLTFGETSLWVTCPSENRVLRINPQDIQVEKHIETSAQPKALVIGEGSVWVLCEKEGKIERIDPKTNKISKTIELGAPATGGAIADGLGSLWVTMPGFPLTRIDTTTEKVIQQFYGEGGGDIHVGLGSLWLTNLNNGTLWRIDPKRVAATLAE
jgi:virginiamycin B lyase